MRVSVFTNKVQSTKRRKGEEKIVFFIYAAIAFSICAVIGYGLFTKMFPVMVEILGDFKDCLKGGLDTIGCIAKIATS